MCTMPSTQGDSHDVRAELEREEQLDLVDPLRHFLAIDASSSDITDLASNNGYSIVPQQIESIIDKRATIRYYRDLARRPELLQDTNAQNDESDADGRCWDVHLKLDMTTGCGGKIWPAAEVLGAYIAAKYSNPEKHQQRLTEANAAYNTHNFDWRNNTIIELGSGTGLVGYLVHALSLSNCQIYVTDQHAMLPLMQENLVLNFPTPTATSLRSTAPTGGFVEVAELNWGTSISPTFGKPDVLLLADCVYLETAFQPLIDTMAELCTPATEILFCYQKRRKADKRFFGMLKKSFVFQDVSDDDEERMKEYRRQGTQLLRIRKK